MYVLANQHTKSGDPFYLWILICQMDRNMLVALSLHTSNLGAPCPSLFIPRSPDDLELDWWKITTYPTCFLVSSKCKSKAGLEVFKPKARCCWILEKLCRKIIWLAIRQDISSLWLGCLHWLADVQCWRSQWSQASLQFHQGLDSERRQALIGEEFPGGPCEPLRTWSSHPRGGRARKDRNLGPFITIPWNRC